MNMLVGLLFRIAESHTWQVRTYHSQTEFQKHGDLISPSHGQIRPSMKLWRWSMSNYSILDRDDALLRIYCPAICLLQVRSRGSLGSALIRQLLKSLLIIQRIVEQFGTTRQAYDS